MFATHRPAKKERNIVDLKKYKNMKDLSKNYGGQLAIPHLFDIQGGVATIMCDPKDLMKVGDTFIKDTQPRGYYTITEVLSARGARGVWKNYGCQPIRIDCTVTYKEASYLEIQNILEATQPA